MTSISTPALTMASRLSVSQAQAALSKAQVELSSGRLADIGTGLGGATARYLSLGSQGSALQTLKDANATTATGLAATTSALDALRATASSFLASLTQAASAGTVQGSLVTTASANLDALTATLNTSVAGQAIFGGINSGQTPLTTYTSASAAKSAVDGAFLSAFGTTQSSASASAITAGQMTSFLGGSYATLFDSAHYKANWSVASDQVTSARISTTEVVDTSVSANAAPFRQLAQAYAMVKEFGGANFGAGAAQSVISAATQLVSTALNGLTTLEGGIGASQAAVSAANDRMSAQISFLSTETDGLVSVDPTSLSTTISGLQTQIQASYEITAQLQQLSLVNYLK